MATRNTRAKFCEMKTSIRHCNTIINVYAMHALQVKDDPCESDQLYWEVANVMNNIKSDRTTSKSLLLVAVDFNTRIEKRKDVSCMGSFSRRKRSKRWQMLINLCCVDNLFLTNSSFKYPVRHVTTSESMCNFMDANNKTQTVKDFDQIYYIIWWVAEFSIIHWHRSE